MEDPAISVPSSIWTSLNSYFTSTVFFILLNLMIATIVFTSNLSNNTNNHQQDDQQQEKQDSNDQQNPPQIVRSPSILNRIKSFNFNTLKPQPGSDPETYYQENPIEVAATQYVFNQPLHYQHFDLDPVNPGQETETGVTQFDYNTIDSSQETEAVMTHFEFEPAHQETEVTHFDFDPTHEEIGSDTGFEDADAFESLDEVYRKMKGGGGGYHDRTKSAGEIPAKVPANPAAGKMKKSASLKVGFSNVESERIVEARRPATVRERKKTVVTAADHDDVEVDAKADDFINKFKNDLKLQRMESIYRTKVEKNVRD
ncbi:uncharacterized protein [Rutidosis leptorrhynchoides]|uniref:uncharacterized protein n=1 Tax=Rutidosis leptorrhynchoides TaxID=125765 RepID=UPI003A98E2FC